jgi:hypothetical protein
MRVIHSALLLVVAGAVPVLAQAPVTALVDWSTDDSARVADLMARGRPYTRASVILWAPPDSMDQAWLASFADTLDAGVASLKALIGGPHDWQRLGTRRLHVYLSPSRFVSHADGRGGVFIAIARARERNAPFLHEAVHELLAPPPPFYPFEYGESIAWERAAAKFPYWLSEGLADYLAQTTAAEWGFPEGDVFEVGGLGQVDSVCAARLAANPRGDEIRERIGRAGPLRALFTAERGEVAPTYYACSQSFTKHVVARTGLPALIGLYPAIPKGTWRASLEKAAGEPLERLRRSWLRALSR